MKLISIKNIFCFILLFSSFANAQDVDPKHHSIKSIYIARLKFYVGIGGALYGGEVTGRQIFGSNSMIKSSKGRPATSIGFLYKLSDRFSVRNEFGYCFIKAQETHATMEEFGRKYNYQFKGDNFDFSVSGQYNIVPVTDLFNKDVKIIPYLTLGLGVTTSNPKGWYHGHWESLQKLTNGQIKNKLLLVIPAGLGGNYRFNQNWEIGLDATCYYTLGGSLDGDSHQGVNTTKLSAEGKEYINQYYNSNYSRVLSDHKRFNDLFLVLQLRVYHTIIPERYKHIFSQQDINYTFRYE